MPPAADGGQLRATRTATQCGRFWRCSAHNRARRSVRDRRLLFIVLPYTATVVAVVRRRALRTNRFTFPAVVAVFENSVLSWASVACTRHPDHSGCTSRATLFPGLWAPCSAAFSSSPLGSPAWPGAGVDLRAAAVFWRRLSHRACGVVTTPATGCSRRAAGAGHHGLPGLALPLGRGMVPANATPWLESLSGSARRSRVVPLRG